MTVEGDKVKQGGEGKRAEYRNFWDEMNTKAPVFRVENDRNRIILAEINFKREYILPHT